MRAYLVLQTGEHHTGLDACRPALVVDLVFSGLGLIPDARPTTNDVFGSIQVDYKLVLNVFATLVFVVLIALTVRRGAIDPVCGMSVDRATLEHDGRTHFFCSEHCRATFAARASGREQPHDGSQAHDHDHAAQHGRV